MTVKGIGIDIAEVSRFKQFKNRNSTFLKKVFSPKELDYAFSFKDVPIHLAGTFAAKEAASKALGTLKFPIITLEVRHTKLGKPEIWHKNKKNKVLISISNTKDIAIAIAIKG